MSSHQIDPQNLPEPANHNEGKTLAAWVTNGLIVLGSLIIAIGLMIPNLVWVWPGAAIIVIGLVVGAVLRGLGHGQPLK